MGYCYRVTIPTPLNPGREAYSLCENGVVLDGYVRAALCLGIKLSDITIEVIESPR